MINLQNNGKMMMPATIFRYSLFVLALSLLIPTGLSAKSGPQSMLELREIALSFIKKHYNSKAEMRIKFSRWDKRIKLSQCAKKNIEAFYPGKQQRLGNVSVGLRCNENKTWTFYLRAYITQKVKIVHSKRFINRGAAITQEDLVVDFIEISNSYSQYYKKPSDIIGKIAKRSISIGKKISATSLKPAMLIKRGQEVIIIAKTAGIIIRTKGKALSDGAKGQVVKVKNVRSKRELQATVIAPNTVQVNM